MCAARLRETRHLWVGNLPDSIREDRILEHFKRYGKVQSVKILPSRSSNESSACNNNSVCATVAFIDIRSASKAHNGENKIEEHVLKTDYYEPPASSTATSHIYIHETREDALLVHRQQQQLPTSSGINLPYSIGASGQGSARAPRHIPSRLLPDDRLYNERDRVGSCNSYERGDRERDGPASYVKPPRNIGYHDDGDYSKSRATSRDSRSYGRNVPNTGGYQEGMERSQTHFRPYTGRSQSQSHFEPLRSYSSEALDESNSTNNTGQRLPPAPTLSGGEGTSRARTLVASVTGVSSTVSSPLSRHKHRRNKEKSRHSVRSQSASPSHSHSRSSSVSSVRSHSPSSSSNISSESPRSSRSGSPSAPKSLSPMSLYGNSRRNSSHCTEKGASSGLASNNSINATLLQGPYHSHQHVNATPGSDSSLLDNGDGKPSLAICVRALPARSTDTSLKDGLFHEYKKHGKVTMVKVVGQGEDRFAVVCFKKPEDVEKALEVSKEKMFFGCKIEVTPHEGIDAEDNDFRPLEAELDEYHPKATRTLFVGNLEKDITTQELRTHFVSFGEIIEIDIKKQGSSTYAFIQYSDISSVVKAMRKLDGENLGANRIKLGFGKSMPTNCVWIHGISENFPEKSLTCKCSRFGPIVTLAIDRERGNALVFYETQESASLAVSDLKGRALNGRRLQIDFASRECQVAFYEKVEDPHAHPQSAAPLDPSKPWERRPTTSSANSYSGSEVEEPRYEPASRTPGSRSGYDSATSGRTRAPGSTYRGTSPTSAAAAQRTPSSRGRTDPVSGERRHRLYADGDDYSQDDDLANEGREAIFFSKSDRKSEFNGERGRGCSPMRLNSEGGDSPSKERTQAECSVSPASCNSKVKLGEDIIQSKERRSRRSSDENAEWSGCGIESQQERGGLSGSSSSCNNQQLNASARLRAKRSSGSDSASLEKICQPGSTAARGTRSSTSPGAVQSLGGGGAGRFGAANANTNAANNSHCNSSAHLAGLRSGSQSRSPPPTPSALSKESAVAVSSASAMSAAKLSHRASAGSFSMKTPHSPASSRSSSEVSSPSRPDAMDIDLISDRETFPINSRSRRKSVEDSIDISASKENHRHRSDSVSDSSDSVIRESLKRKLTDKEPHDTSNPAENIGHQERKKRLLACIEPINVSKDKSSTGGSSTSMNKTDDEILLSSELKRINVQANVDLKSLDKQKQQKLYDFIGKLEDTIVDREDPTIVRVQTVLHLDATAVMPETVCRVSPRKLPAVVKPTKSVYGLKEPGVPFKSIDVFSSIVNRSISDPRTLSTTMAVSSFPAVKGVHREIIERSVDMETGLLTVVSSTEPSFVPQDVHSTTNKLDEQGSSEVSSSSDKPSAGKLNGPLVLPLPEFASLLWSTSKLNAVVVVAPALSVSTVAVPAVAVQSNAHNSTLHSPKNTSIMSPLSSFSPCAGLPKRLREKSTDSKGSEVTTSDRDSTDTMDVIRAPASVSSTRSRSEDAPSEGETETSIEDRIRALDEKYKARYGATPAPAAVAVASSPVAMVQPVNVKVENGPAVSLQPTIDYSKYNIKKKSQVNQSASGDFQRAEPSDIVKSLLSKSSIFDQDSKRLEHINEKYEPKDAPDAAAQARSGFRTKAAAKEFATPTSKPSNTSAVASLTPTEKPSHADAPPKTATTNAHHNQTHPHSSPAHGSLHRKLSDPGKLPAVLKKEPVTPTTPQSAPARTFGFAPFASLSSSSATSTTTAASNPSKASVSAVTKKDAASLAASSNSSAPKDPRRDAQHAENRDPRSAPKKDSTSHLHSSSLSSHNVLPHKESAPIKKDTTSAGSNFAAAFREQAKSDKKQQSQLTQQRSLPSQPQPHALSSKQLGATNQMPSHQQKSKSFDATPAMATSKRHSSSEGPQDSDMEWTKSSGSGKQSQSEKPKHFSASGSSSKDGSEKGELAVTSFGSFGKRPDKDGKKLSGDSKALLDKSKLTDKNKDEKKLNKKDSKDSSKAESRQSKGKLDGRSEKERKPSDASKMEKSLKSEKKKDKSDKDREKGSTSTSESKGKDKESSGAKKERKAYKPSSELRRLGITEAPVFFSMYDKVKARSSANASLKEATKDYEGVKTSFCSGSGKESHKDGSSDSSDSDSSRASSSSTKNKAKQHNLAQKRKLISSSSGSSSDDQDKSRKSFSSRPDLKHPPKVLAKRKESDSDSDEDLDKIAQSVLAGPSKKMSTADSGSSSEDDTVRREKIFTKKLKDTKERPPRKLGDVSSESSDEDSRERSEGRTNQKKELKSRKKRDEKKEWKGAVAAHKNKGAHDSDKNENQKSLKVDPKLQKKKVISSGKDKEREKERPSDRTKDGKEKKKSFEENEDALKKRKKKTKNFKDEIERKHRDKNIKSVEKSTEGTLRLSSDHEKSDVDVFAHEKMHTTDSEVESSSLAPSKCSVVVSHTEWERSECGRLPADASSADSSHSHSAKGFPDVGFKTPKKFSKSEFALKPESKDLASKKKEVPKTSKDYEKGDKSIKDERKKKNKTKLKERGERDEKSSSEKSMSAEDKARKDEKKTKARQVQAATPSSTETVKTSSPPKPQSLSSVFSLNTSSLPHNAAASSPLSDAVLDEEIQEQARRLKAELLAHVDDLSSDLVISTGSPESSEVSIKDEAKEKISNRRFEEEAAIESQRLEELLSNNFLPSNFQDLPRPFDESLQAQVMTIKSTTEVSKAPEPEPVRHFEIEKTETKETSITAGSSNEIFKTESKQMDMDDQRMMEDDLAVSALLAVEMNDGLDMVMKEHEPYMERESSVHQMDDMSYMGINDDEPALHIAEDVEESDNENLEETEEAKPFELPTEPPAEPLAKEVPRLPVPEQEVHSKVAEPEVAKAVHEVAPTISDKPAKVSSQRVSSEVLVEKEPKANLASQEVVGITERRQSVISVHETPVLPAADVLVEEPKQPETSDIKKHLEDRHDAASDHSDKTEIFDDFTSELGQKRADVDYNSAYNADSEKDYEDDKERNIERPKRGRRAKTLKFSESTLNLPRYESTCSEQPVAAPRRGRPPLGDKVRRSPRVAGAAAGDQSSECGHGESHDEHLSGEDGVKGSGEDQHFEEHDPGTTGKKKRGRKKKVSGNELAIEKPKLVVEQLDASRQKERILLSLPVPSSDKNVSSDNRKSNSPYDVFEFRDSDDDLPPSLPLEGMHSAPPKDVKPVEAEKKALTAEDLPPKLELQDFTAKRELEKQQEKEYYTEPSSHGKLSITIRLHQKDCEKDGASGTAEVVKTSKAVSPEEKSQKVEQESAAAAAAAELAAKGVRKSARLMSQTTSKSTVDEIIEDVVKGTNKDGEPIRCSRRLARAGRRSEDSFTELEDELSDSQDMDAKDAKGNSLRSYRITRSSTRGSTGDEQEFLQDDKDDDESAEEEFEEAVEEPEKPAAVVQEPPTVPAVAPVVEPVVPQPAPIQVAAAPVAGQVFVRKEVAQIPDVHVPAHVEPPKATVKSELPTPIVAATTSVIHETRSVIPSVSERLHNSTTALKLKTGKGYIEQTISHEAVVAPSPITPHDQAVTTPAPGISKLATQDTQFAWNVAPAHQMPVVPPTTVIPLQETPQINVFNATKAIVRPVQATVLESRVPEKQFVPATAALPMKVALGKNDPVLPPPAHTKITLEPKQSGIQASVVTSHVSPGIVAASGTKQEQKLPCKIKGPNVYPTGPENVMPHGSAGLSEVLANPQISQQHKEAYLVHQQQLAQQQLLSNEQRSVATPPTSSALTPPPGLPLGALGQMAGSLAHLRPQGQPQMIVPAHGHMNMHPHLPDIQYMQQMMYANQHAPYAMLPDPLRVQEVQARMGLNPGLPGRFPPYTSLPHSMTGEPKFAQEAVHPKDAGHQRVAEQQGKDDHKNKSKSKSEVDARAAMEMRASNEEDMKRHQEQAMHPPMTPMNPLRIGVPMSYQAMRAMHPHLLSPHERFNDSPAGMMHNFHPGRPMPTHIQPMQQMRAQDGQDHGKQGPEQAHVHHIKQNDDREKNALPLMKQPFQSHNEPMALSRQSPFNVAPTNAGFMDSRPPHAASHSPGAFSFRKDVPSPIAGEKIGDRKAVRGPAVYPHPHKASSPSSMAMNHGPPVHGYHMHPGQLAAEQQQREREEGLMRRAVGLPMPQMGSEAPMSHGPLVPHGVAMAQTPLHQSHPQTPPHAQVPQQSDSFFLNRHPVVWQGLLALKNDQAAVQMHFVSGSLPIAKASLPPILPEGGSAPVRISQRMRLEQTQLDGVARKMQMVDEHCILLAMPCGRDHMDVLQQSKKLQDGFITYLQSKQAAGIVNSTAPGSHQTAYVIHIFPSCDFSNDNVTRIAPDLLHIISEIAHLLIVIATV